MSYATLNLESPKYRPDLSAKERQQAAHLIQKGLEGDPASLSDVGTHCFKGTLFVQDVRIAGIWYKAAADRGSAPALFNLEMLKTATGQEMSRSQFLQAGIKGISTGVVNAGALYEKEGNVEGALALYRKVISDPKATDVAKGVAYNNLGGLYVQGVGVPKSDKIAHDYFRLSAKYGCKNAYHNLGAQYYRGEGVDKNIPLGLEFYTRAANGGYVKSMIALGRHYLENKDAKAMDWFSKAAQLESSEGIFWVGKCYRFGIGVRKDPKQGILKYLEAAELGHQEARYECREFVGRQEYAKMDLSDEEKGSLFWIASTVLIKDENTRHLAPIFIKEAARLGNKEAEFAITPL